MSGQASYIEPVERPLRQFVEDFRREHQRAAAPDALRRPFEERVHANVAGTSAIGR